MELRNAGDADLTRAWENFLAMHEHTASESGVPDELVERFRIAAHELHARALSTRGSETA
jgi:hypothetical protein